MSKRDHKRESKMVHSRFKIALSLKYKCALKCAIFVLPATVFVQDGTVWFVALFSISLAVHATACDVRTCD